MKFVQYTLVIPLKFGSFKHKGSLFLGFHNPLPKALPPLICFLRNKCCQNQTIDMLLDMASIVSFNGIKLMIYFMQCI